MSSSDWLNADGATPDWIAAQYSAGQVRLWAMQGASVIGQRVLGPVAPSVAAMQAAMGDAPAGPIPVVMADLSGLWPDHDDIPPEAPAPAALRPVPLGGRFWRIGGLRQGRARVSGHLALAAGILAAQPQFDGVICLPGPQSLWLRVSAAEICHFQAYPTGDLLSCLGGAEAADQVTRAPEILAAAQEDALSRPHRAYGRLSALRGGAGTDASELAGLLIGIELADAKPYWLGQMVAVAGPAPLTPLYADALERQGTAVLRPGADAALLAGLHGVWQRLGV